MFVQKFANGGSTSVTYGGGGDPEILFDANKDAVGITKKGGILLPEIIITDPIEDEGALETSDYQNYYGIPRIIDRSKSQKGDYGTFKGLSPTFTRESSDYTQGDDRQVDDPEIIRRNIEKTMIPQGGNVTPQGGYPDMNASRVPPTIPQGGDVTPQGGYPDMNATRVPPTIPQSLGDVGTFQDMNPNFNQGQVQSTQGGIANIPFGQSRVPTPAVPVAISGQAITSQPISGAGAISDGIASGTGNDMSGGTGGGTTLEEIIVDGGSPPPPPRQSGPSFIGQIAPAAALTALGASFAKNVGGSDEDPVKELREIAQSLRGSTMPLNMPVFRSEGSPPFGEGLIPGYYPGLNALRNMFKDKGPFKQNPLINRIPDEGDLDVGQQTGDPQTVGVQGPINLTQTSQGIKTDVGDILDDSQKSDKKPDPESDQESSNQKKDPLEALQLISGKKDSSDSIKDRFKERYAVYKDLLGVDDNERKMNAYLVLAQAAANVAKSAGKNRKVLDVLSEGLQTLPLGLAKVRAADRKEDLAIGTAALSSVESQLAAEASANAAINKLFQSKYMDKVFNPTDLEKATNVLKNNDQFKGVDSQTGLPKNTLSGPSLAVLLKGNLLKENEFGDIVDLTNSVPGLHLDGSKIVVPSGNRKITSRDIDMYGADYSQKLKDLFSGRINEEEFDKYAESIGLGGRLFTTQASTIKKEVEDARAQNREIRTALVSIENMKENAADIADPTTSFKRGLAKFFVPIFGDEAGRKLLEERKAPARVINEIMALEGKGQKRLKLLAELEVEQYANLRPGFLTDKRVMIADLNSFSVKLMNKYLENLALIGPGMAQAGRRFSKIPDGSRDDPYPMSMLFVPAVQSSIKGITEGKDDELVYIREKNGTVSPYTYSGLSDL